MHKNFDRDYDHHAPRDESDVAAHEAVRRACKSHAQFLDAHVPVGRERAMMFTKLEEAMFWANAAIARARYPDHGEELHAALAQSFANDAVRKVTK